MPRTRSTLLGRPRVNFIGLGVSPITMAETLAAFDWAITSRANAYVCCAAVHSALEARRDPGLLKVLNRSLLTTPDGMPLVWWCRSHGHREVERVYGPELLLAACRESVVKGYRHFFLGSSDQVLRDLVRNLEGRFQHLQVVGWLSPEYKEGSYEWPDRHAVDEIRERKPDIVWVALGTGKQERWMARHVDEVGAPLMVGVGVAFEYVAGHKPQAPTWLRRAGLEWVFWLATEPARLWRRYLAYPKFVLMLAAQALRLRSYPMLGRESSEPGK